MLKPTMTSFFRPSRLIVILVVAMISVAIPAQFQRWDETVGEPKPPFYDELKQYPFRTIYAYLMIPLAFVAVVGLILSLWGMYDLPTGMTSSWGIVIHVTYFYILSCFIGLIYRSIRDNEGWHERVQKAKPT